MSFLLSRVLDLLFLFLVLLAVSNSLVSLSLCKDLGSFSLCNKHVGHHFVNLLIYMCVCCTLLLTVITFSSSASSVLVLVKQTAQFTSSYQPYFCLTSNLNPQVWLIEPNAAGEKRCLLLLKYKTFLCWIFPHSYHS